MACGHQHQVLRWSPGAEDMTGDCLQIPQAESAVLALPNPAVVVLLAMLRGLAVIAAAYNRVFCMAAPPGWADAAQVR